MDRIDCVEIPRADRWVRYRMRHRSISYSVFVQYRGEPNPRDYGHNPFWAFGVDVTISEAAIPEECRSELLLAPDANHDTLLLRHIPMAHAYSRAGGWGDRPGSVVLSWDYQHSGPGWWRDDVAEVAQDARVVIDQLLQRYPALRGKSYRTGVWWPIRDMIPCGPEGQGTLMHPSEAE